MALPDRITNRIDRSGGDDSCWLWMGARGKPRAGVKTGQDYGYVSVGGKVMKVHRLVWADLHGPIPAGQVVRHTCDNPPCCNPRHLSLGTQVDNAQDRQARGRQRGGPGNIHDRRALMCSGT